MCVKGEARGGRIIFFFETVAMDDRLRDRGQCQADDLAGVAVATATMETAGGTEWILLMTVVIVVVVVLLLLLLLRCVPWLPTKHVRTWAAARKADLRLLWPASAVAAP